MKVLHFINSLETGGAERLIINMLPKIAKQGVEVDLLLISDSDTAFKQELIKGSFNGKIIELGVDRKNPMILFKIHKLIKSYDIIHSHLFPSNYWVILYKLFYKNTPVLVYTEHSTYSKKWDYNVLRSLDRFIYSQYTSILAISEGVKDVLTVKLGVNPKLCKVIENGIDLDKFQRAIPIDPDLLFGVDNFIVIMAGIFKKEKDHFSLIRAIKQLPVRVKLILAGDGYLLEDCKKLVEDLNLQDRVIFLGMVPDVERYLQSSDVIVLSSFHEGFGLAAIEGMAAGKPVIASDIEGLNDVVRGAGILVKKASPKAIAEEVKLLMDDKDHYYATKARCLLRSKNYGIDKMVDQTLQHYNKLLVTQ